MLVAACSVSRRGICVDPDFMERKSKTANLGRPIVERKFSFRSSGSKMPSEEKFFLSGKEMYLLLRYHIGSTVHEMPHRPPKRVMEMDREENVPIIE